MKEISGDLKDTIRFYQTYNDVCCCDRCRNYYNKIQITYPKLDIFLKQYGVDILKPVEVIEYSFDDDLVKVYESFYVVCGDLKEKNAIILDDGLEIKILDKNDLFEIFVNENYFLIQVNGIRLDGGY